VPSASVIGLSSMCTFFLDAAIVAARLRRASLGCGDAVDGQESEFAQQVW
jgi:hypothetical protein